MDAKRKIEIGKVYSAKVGGTFLPVRIEKSLGHGRYEGRTVRADGTGSTVKTCTDAIRGEGQDEKAFLTARAPKPVPEAEVKAIEAAAKAPRAKKAPKEKRAGGLDAAAAVLAEAGQPLGVKDLVERMLATGLWKTGGKTPAATIYAAIIREIAVKGGQARFRKTGPGTFGLAK